MKVTFEIPDQEFSNIIEATLLKVNNDSKNNTPVKLYTINQVSKLLGRSHVTIKRIVEKGLIKTTKDNLITEIEINNYLKNV
jgi:hypothetical protein